MYATLILNVYNPNPNSKRGGYIPATVYAYVHIGHACSRYGDGAATPSPSLPLPVTPTPTPTPNSYSYP